MVKRSRTGLLALYVSASIGTAALSACQHEPLVAPSNVTSTDDNGGDDDDDDDHGSGGHGSDD